MSNGIERELHLKLRRRIGNVLQDLRDRGSQYASQAFRSVLAAHRMQASMSRKGDVYDNAAMESCFRTIKTELVHKASYATRAAARQAIFE